MDWKLSQAMTISITSDRGEKTKKRRPRKREQRASVRMARSMNYSPKARKKSREHVDNNYKNPGAKKEKQ